ncbi:MAG: HAMP domain-containing histidine kinase [Chloroflexi bacterium]|nr:HAMP domain-containing histidine kinase [Chloroflexota bacterium]
MFASLRSRLWLTYLMLVVVVLGVIGVSLFIYLARHPNLYQQTALHLRIAEAAIALRADALDVSGAARIEQIVQREDQILQVRILILRSDGEVLADSRSGKAAELILPRTPFKVPPADQISILSLRDVHGGVWLYRLSQLDAQRYLLVALPRPRVPLLTILKDEFNLLVTRTGLIALVMALLLGWGMARWISAPLQRIGAAAKSTAAGEYRTIPLEGPREVQDLAGAFNEMTHRVQASQQSQREFIANVSHELKTPLTSIQGFAQAILDGAAATPESLRQAASVIYGEAGRMSRLVMDLLTLARLDAGTADLHRTPLDLGGLLQSVAEKMTPQAQQAQVELQVALDPLPLYNGDEDRLAQVFTNLVDNALKFTPPGGTVTLSGRQVPGSVEISIADTGPGVPAEDQTRIFERFFQTDKSRRGGTGRGVGLGLAIAQEIIRAHGGAIRLESQPGQGSNFVVKLPV